MKHPILTETTVNLSIISIIVMPIYRLWILCWIITALVILYCFDILPSYYSMHDLGTTITVMECSGFAHIGFSAFICIHDRNFHSSLLEEVFLAKDFQWKWKNFLRSSLTPHLERFYLLFWMHSFAGYNILDWYLLLCC